MSGVYTAAGCYLVAGLVVALVSLMEGRGGDSRYNKDDIPPWLTIGLCLLFWWVWVPLWALLKLSTDSD